MTGTAHEVMVHSGGASSVTPYPDLASLPYSPNGCIGRGVVPCRGDALRKITAGEPLDVNYLVILKTALE